MTLNVVKTDLKMKINKFQSQKVCLLQTALTFMFMAVSTLSYAQKLKTFTLEDLNFGGNNYHNMIAKNRWTTWWGDQLVRLDTEECYIINKATGKETKLFTLFDLTKIKGVDNIHSLYDATFPNAKKSIVKIGNLLIDWKKKLCTVDATPKAYIKNYQLYVKDKNGKEHQLSTDGSRNIVYGQSVHRDEFGISDGRFWSPNKEKLAFYRMDQSMVTDYPLVNIPEIEWNPEKNQSRIATPAPEKYPMAGETSHEVTVGIYNLKTNKTIYLKAGNPQNRYFTNIAWGPDNQTVYIFELNRDQNDCRLVSYNSETGEKIAELYRETDTKYVEPQHPIVFLPWDHSKFILQSQKDGYNHFYLFNTQGKLLKQITSGNWVVMDFIGFNAKQHSIIYASNELSPIQRNIFSVNLESGKRTLIDDNGKGWHHASLSPNGQFITDNYQTPTIPRKIAIINIDNSKRTPYYTAEDPWKGYNVPEYSCGTLKAADGKTDLYYRMVKPVNFDPNKKYPTIIYVYGGPHAHNVDARWHYSSRGWETYMAQNGYLLFILDNRGSENRGKEFEQATFRHLGQEETKDQMKGVDFLKSLSYVDTTRIGVHGWSFGGYMTITMMTHHPETFKVGVAGGPVIDWKWYEVMYGERYMDTPENNPEGYQQTSLLNQAKNLKGKLQIIIGLNDPVVVPQHAFSFLKACIGANTQPDFFVYPGEPHNMRGHQSTHLHERISQYFFDYLK